MIDSSVQTTPAYPWLKTPPPPTAPPAPRPWDKPVYRPPAHPSPDSSGAEWSAYWAGLGWALVPIPPGAKGPEGIPGWQTRTFGPEYWHANPKHGMGARLKDSGLVSFDGDALEEARLALAAVGIELDALKTGAVIVQGNPDRWRAMYRLPPGADGLSLKKLIWPPRESGGKPITVFELRAGPVQDALPPTIHPGTGESYRLLVAPWELAEWTAPPADLLELWRDWEHWKPLLEAACPWAPAKPEPATREAPRERAGGESVIDAFNRAHDPASILASHGYKPKGPNRWLSPHSGSGLAGIVRLSDTGRIYCHHASDPLAGPPHDAFSLFTVLEYNGDTRAAVKAAARLLGMGRECPPRQDTDPQGQAAPDGQAAGRKPGWRLVPVRELLTDPEPLRWLIRGYLQPDSLNLLFGDPVAGKSLLAIDWAARVSTGRAWLGHAPTPAPVVYLAGEGFFGIKRRLFAWGLANDCLEELRAAPLVVSSAGAALTDDAQVAVVAAAIDAIAAEHGQPALIVIDTLARNFGAADENSAADVGLFVHAADYLRTRYQAAVLVVHHSGHGDKGRSRGSSAIRGAVDAEFCLSADAMGDRILAATKTKDAPPPEPLSFTLRVINLPWHTDDGEQETSVVLQPNQASGSTSRRRKAPPSVTLAFESLLACLDESGEQPPDDWQPPAKSGPRPELAVPLDAWREEFLSRHTGDSEETKGRAFRRARVQMTDSHVIGVWRNLYWPRHDVAPWPDLAAMLSAADLCREANEADAGQSPDNHRTFSTCPDTDKERTYAGQSSDCPDMSGHTPKGVSVCPPCPPVRSPPPDADAANPSQDDMLEVVI